MSRRPLIAIDRPAGTHDGGQGWDPRIGDPPGEDRAQIAGRPRGDPECSAEAAGREAEDQLGQWSAVQEHQKWEEPTEKPADPGGCQQERDCGVMTAVHRNRTADGDQPDGWVEHRKRREFHWFHRVSETSAGPDS